MKITLVIDGKECDYFARVTARKGRDAYNLKKEIIKELTDNNKSYTQEMQDKLLAFVVEAFDRQFTAQEYLDGYQGWFFDAMDIVNLVMDNITDALAEGFPKNLKPKTETTAK